METSRVKRKTRVSVVAAWQNQAIKAPMRFEGHCNTELFNTWLKQGLLPELEEGQTIIMDNASFHKSARTRELIEAHGCKLQYLPTYSPDLNPIEKQWAILKARIKKHRFERLHLSKAIDRVFKMY